MHNKQSWTVRDKTVLITGATGEIGKAIAIGLANLGAHLILVDADDKRGAELMLEIQRETYNHHLEFIAADLSSLDAVHRLGENFRHTHNKLDVLINSAGGIFSERAETVDGFERTFAINHLSPFLLTQLLVPMLEAQPEGRIINLTSGAHRMMPVDIDNLQAQTWDYGLAVYARAQLVNLMVSYELDRRLRGRTHVTVNNADAGHVAVAMANGIPPDLFPPKYRLAYPFLRLMQRNLTAERAALSSILLAAQPEFTERSGLYMLPTGKLGESSPASYSATMAYQLYEMTQAMLPMRVLAVAV